MVSNSFAEAADSHLRGWREMMIPAVFRQQAQGFERSRQKLKFVPALWMSVGGGASVDHSVSIQEKIAKRLVVHDEPLILLFTAAHSRVCDCRALRLCQNEFVVPIWSRLRVLV
jgi:hypothetical protein